MLHFSDYLIMLCIVAAVLIPELLPGFSRRRALIRLAILVVFCIFATILASYLQHADSWVTFTRTFLIAMSARISLLLNHIAEATLQKLGNPIK